MDAKYHIWENTLILAESDFISVCPEIDTFNFTMSKMVKDWEDTYVQHGVQL